MAQRWTLSPAEAASLERISTELARIGLVLPGSVAVRSYRCGKPNCACHAEASRLHGPYNQWSRRAANKTVHVNLSPDRLDDYQQLIDNHRRLEALIEALEALSLAVVQRDLHPDNDPTPTANRTDPA